MFCSTGEVVFIHSYQVNKACTSTLLLVSSQGLLVVYIWGDIKSMYSELALYGSNNECARTDDVFLLISEVCTMGAILAIYLNGNFQTTANSMVQYQSRFSIDVRDVYYQNDTLTTHE